jgi:hypothetical protein
MQTITIGWEVWNSFSDPNPSPATTLIEQALIEGIKNGRCRVLIQDEEALFPVVVHQDCLTLTFGVAFKPATPPPFDANSATLDPKNSIRLRVNKG